MAFQTASNILVAVKRETVMGEPPGATDAHVLRIVDSDGLRLERATIASNEKRPDATRQMGRLGAKSVPGSYTTEITLGGAVDLLLESIMRSTWTASASITESTAGLTSITTTASTIVASAGSWITAGVRVGDIVRLTGHTTAANNGINLRVTNVTATTITVAGAPLTANGVADSSFTLTRLKKLVTPSEPVRYTHAFEQYDVDVDRSELFLGVRIVGLQLNFQPGQPATMQWTLQGLDRDLLDDTDSPYFTSPTRTTGLALIADDSMIRYNGVDVASFTGFTLTFEIANSTPQVIGSTTPPNVFDNDLTVSGQLTGLRQDFSNLELYDEETEFGISILLQEIDTSPRGCLGFYLPRVKIARAGAPVGGGDGPKVETVDLMIGTREAATGHDATVALISSSAS